MQTPLLGAVLALTCGLSLAAEFEVKLVQATANADLPRSVPQEVQPMNNQHGATLSFLIKGEDIVEIDQKSLKLETGGKWEIGFFNKVSEDGAYALLNLSTNKEILGQLDALKLKGTVKVVTGSEMKTETLTLTDGAEAVKVGTLSVSYKGEKSDKKKKGFGFGMGSGIHVKGDLATVKSIIVKVDGEEADSNGHSTFNNNRNYQFAGLKGDPVEVTLTYWTDLQTVVVPIVK